MMPIFKAPFSARLALRALLAPLALLALLAVPRAQGQEAAPSLVTFEADRLTVRETDAALSLSLRVPKPLGDTLVFGLSVEPLDGASAGKLISLDNQLVLLPGDDGLVVNFLIEDDGRLSGDQSYAVRLYPISLGANQGVLSPEPALIRILDDEALAPARLVDASVDEAAGTLELLLQLDRPAGVSASATLELFPDTAKDDKDYVSRRETVTLAPGEESARFSIKILDDEVFEAEERLIARIVQSEALEVLDFDAQILIRDDDPPPALSVSAAQAREGQPRGTVSVSLDRAAGVVTSLAYDFRSGTATLGEDFSGVSGTLTFPPGVTRQFINFDMVDDRRDEAEEAFDLIFRDAVGLRPPEGPITIAVLDDDPEPRLRIDAPELTEGREAEARFTLDAPSDRPITVTVQLAAGSAGVPEDVAPAEATFTFAPGETGPRTLSLRPLDDEVFEDTESLRLVITAHENVRVPDASVELALIDTNPRPELSLAAVRAVEGNRGEAGTDASAPNGLLFRLSAATSRPASFTLTLQEGRGAGQVAGQAQAGEDFATLSDVYSFAAGQTELFVPLTIIDNARNEADETLTVALALPDQLTLAAATYPVTIIDDDPPPRLTIEGPDTVNEGSDAPLELTLTLSEVSGQDIDLELLLEAVDATGETNAAAETDETPETPDAPANADFEALPPRLTVPAGQRQIRLTLQPRDDALFERVEDFALTLTPLGDTLQGPARAALSLVDDDEPPIVRLTVPPLSEGDVRGDAAPLFLTLSKPAGLDTVVELGVFEGSAREGQDYEIPTTSILIRAGQNSAQLPLRLIDDGVHEGAESFEIALLSADAALIDENLLTVTIADDDDEPEITILTPEVGEGDGERGLLTFTLTTPSDRQVAFDYALSDGTATLGQDYLTENGTLAFAPGQTERRLDLQIIDDRTFEESQDLRVTISNIQGAGVRGAQGDPGEGAETAAETGDTAEAGDAAPAPTSAPTSATWRLVLADNDPLPRLIVTDAQVLEAETDTPATLTFALDRRAEVPVAFSYRLAEEAVQSADLALAPGRLTFAPGEQVKELQVQPLQDAIDEDQEIFHILLSEAQNLRLPETAARVTLIDDDPAPNLFISDAVLAEPRLPQAQGAGDSDAQDVTDATDPATPADQPAEGQMVFTLSLSAASGRTVRAAVRTAALPTAPFPASAGDDFADTGRTVTFPPGVREVRVAVPVIADGLDEEDEEFGLLILNAENANLIDASAVGLIRDGDAQPRLRADDLAVLESASAEAAAAGEPLPALRLHLSHASGKDVFVTYALIPETAQVGSDIEPVQGTLIFPAGTLEQFIPLRLLNDALDEGVETLSLALSNPIGATLEAAGATGQDGQDGGQDGNQDDDAQVSVPGGGLIAAVLTITDDDLGPALSVETRPLREGLDAGRAVARVSLARASAQPLTLTWQTRGKTATAGADFVPQQGSLTFQPGQTLAEIPIEVLEDAIDERDEEVELLLTSDQIRIAAPTTAIVIQDNDPAPSFRLLPAPLDERTQITQLTLALDAAAERDLPGSLSLSAASATLGAASATLGEDFDLPTRDFLIPAGASTLNIPIELTDDAIDESEEAFTLIAELLVDDAPLPARTTYTIADDDAEPSLTLVDLDVGEGTAAAMTLEVSEPSSKAITLTYTTVSGSALAGEEFEDVTRSLTIAPNTASVQLPLTLIDDGVDEIAETFTVRLSQVRAAQIAKGVGQVTVLDDDPPVRVTLGLPSATPTPTPEASILGEEDGRLSVPVRLSQASGHPVELELETVSGIAIANEDYVPRVGRVLLEPGQTEAAFTIDLIDDGFEEALETFGVKIISARNADFDAAPILVGIVDNDRAASLSVETLRMAEAEGSDGGLIQFTLTAESNDVVVVEYDVIDGTAENNVDYALGPGALIFLPGETEKQIAVPLQADGVDEFDETFVLTILAANVDIPEDQITIAITDSDAPPALTLASASPREDAGELQIDLLIEGATQKEVSGNLVLTPGAAFAPSLTAQTLPFTIPPGQGRVSLSVPLIDDGFDEFDEAFTLALNDTVNAALPRRVFDGTIRNDDPPATVRLAPQRFAEGSAGQSAVEITLDPPSGKPVSFDFTLADVTAQAGQDWQGQNSQARLTPGQERLTIPVTIVDDSLFEGDEAFEVTVSNLVNAQAPQPSARYTIVEDEAAPRLSVAPAEVVEGQPAALAVALDTPSSLPLQVSITVADGTASLGRDLEPLLPELVFPPGQTEGEILLVPIDDPFDEFDEEVFLTFASALVQTPELPVTITLKDNDDAPELAVIDVEQLEDVSGVLDLSLSLASNKPITFTVVAEAGTATLGEDFDFSPQTITLAPGESQVTLPLTLIDDQLDEDVETYHLVFSEVENLRLSQDRATIRLIDTDPEPQLAVSDVIVDEGASGDQAFMDLRLSEPSGRPVTVRVVSADLPQGQDADADSPADPADTDETDPASSAPVSAPVSALGGADYEPVAREVVFAPGETVQRLPLTLLDDTLFETSESFVLRLAGVENALVPPREARVTILDNDPQPALVYRDQSVAERQGDPAFAISIGLSSPAGQDITVPFDLTGQDAARPDVVLDSLSLTFKSGETRARLTGRVLDDDRDEADLQLRLTAVPNASFIAPDAPLILTVRDDDPAPALRLETRPLSEGGASTTASINPNDGALIARLSGPSEKTVRAELAYVNGTAVAGQDFVAGQQTLIFAPGQTQITLPLELIDDGIFELEETLDLVLSAAQDATLPQPRVRLSILDDDPQPRLTLLTTPLIEGQSAQGEVRLDTPSSLGVSLSYVLTSDTAREGQDFEAQQGTLTFAPGQTRQTFTLSALGDEIDEGEETALFTVLSVTNARMDAVTTPIAIIDQNERPTLAIESAPTPEGSPEGGLLFTLRLSHPSASPLAFAYTTIDETALGGQDYVATTGTLVFEPGQRRKTLRVDLIDDGLFEGDEAFALRLAFADGPADERQVRARITDDEAPPQLVVDAAPTPEDAGEIAVVLSLDRPTAVPLGFTYETLDGEALAGADYRPASGSFRFSPDQRSALVFIELLDDRVREGPESLTLRFTLSELAPNQEGGGPDASPDGSPDGDAQGTPRARIVEAAIAIRDNDPLPLILADPLPIAEDEGGDGSVKIATYPLRLDAASAQTVTLAYQTVFDGEADANDVTPSEGTVTFAPGETEAAIALEIRQDGVAEGAESLTLAFTEVSNARISNPRARLTLTETRTPTLTVLAAEAVEGDDLTFDLVLSPISPRPLYILYGPVDGQGAPLSPPQAYIFPAGASRASLRVPTDNNTLDEADRSLDLLIQVAEDSPLKLAAPSVLAQGLIRDDDADPVLTIAATSALAEGREGALTVQLEGRTSKTGDVILTIGNGGAAQPGEDIEPLRVRLPIQELGRSTQVPIRIIDDGLNEYAEAFELRVEGADVALRIDQESLTIADNDPVPVLSGGRLILREDGGQPPTLSLNQASGRDLRLLFAIENPQGSAAALEGADFVARAREVLVPAGRTQIPLPLDLIDDDTFELTEDFTLAITAAEFVEVSQARIPVRILDDDPAPRLTARLEDAGEGARGALVLALDAPSAVDTVVAVTAVDGTAQRGLDFDLETQQIILPAGVTSAEVAVAYLSDGIFEGPETFSLLLEMIQGATLADAQLIGRIADADAAPTIQIADRAVLETTQGDILIDFQAFGAFKNPIELTYTLTGDTAQAGQDFVAKTGTLIIQPNQPEGFITFRLLDDNEPEGTERFTLSLSSVPPIDLPPRPIAIDIIDNESFTQP